MIEDLRIDGFRGLDDFPLGPLGRVNVIVGPGGSGKTSLLEAVFLFSETGNPGGLVTVLGQRSVPLQGRTTDEAADLLSWFASTGRRMCEISGRWNGVQRRVRIERSTPTLVAVPIVSPGVQGTPASAAPASAVFEMETVHGAERRVGWIYAAAQGLVSDPSLGHWPTRIHGVMAHHGAAQALAPLWTQVEDRGESKGVEDLLRLLDPDVEGIRVASGRSSTAYLRVHHRRLGHVPLEFLGDGFSKALSIACNLAGAAGGVLVVDEFDVSLHIGALRTVVSFAIEGARRLDAQLFLSTHSLDTVDAFVDLSLPADDLHVLRLSRPGVKARVHNLDHERARSLREEVGLDLRRA